MYEILRVILVPIHMNALTQPAKKLVKLAFADLLFEVGDILIDDRPLLSGNDVTQRVRGEVTDHAA